MDPTVEVADPGPGSSEWVCQAEGTRKLLTGWGGTPASVARLVRPERPGTLELAVAGGTPTFVRAGGV